MLCAVLGGESSHPTCWRYPKYPSRQFTPTRIPSTGSVPLFPARLSWGSAVPCVATWSSRTRIIVLNPGADTRWRLSNRFAQLTSWYVDWDLFLMNDPASSPSHGKTSLGRHHLGPVPIRITENIIEVTVGETWSCTGQLYRRVDLLRQQRPGNLYRP